MSAGPVADCQEKRMPPTAVKKKLKKPVRKGSSGRTPKKKDNVLALEDDLRAIGMKVPAEEWRKLPHDFNENLDHYLYGSPKKKPSRD